MSSTFNIIPANNSFDIIRADGLRVNLEKIDVDSESKKILAAGLYPKISAILLSNRDTLKNIINETLSKAFFDTNTRLDVSGQTAMKVRFFNELEENYPNLTSKEFENIIYLGVRGKLRGPEETFDGLSLTNFTKWTEIYLEKKNESNKRVVIALNSYEFEMSEPEVDMMYKKMVDLHVDEINKILKLKVSAPDLYETKIAEYTSIFPEVIYDLLINIKVIKSPASFGKFIEQAKELLVLKTDEKESRLITVLSARDLFNNREERTIQKAKQLAIINTLKSKSGINAKL